MEMDFPCMCRFTIYRFIPNVHDQNPATPTIFILIENLAAVAISSSSIENLCDLVSFSHWPCSQIAKLLRSCMATDLRSSTETQR